MGSKNPAGNPVFFPCVVRLRGGSIVYILRGYICHVYQGMYINRVNIFFLNPSLLNSLVWKIKDREFKNILYGSLSYFLHTLGTYLDTKLTRCVHF